MKLIETEWQDYAKKIIPPGAPKVQIVESRRAFYAGARSLLTSLVKVFGPDKEPTESDLAIMDGVQEELDQFYKDISEGRA
jgi:hypothetical protein